MHLVLWNIQPTKFENNLQKMYAVTYDCVFMQSFFKNEFLTTKLSSKISVFEVSAVSFSEYNFKSIWF